VKLEMRANQDTMELQDCMVEVAKKVIVEMKEILVIEEKLEKTEDWGQWARKVPKELLVMLVEMDSMVERESEVKTVFKVYLDHKVH
jgi:hypothetical protein